MQHSSIEWLKGPDGSQGYSWNPTSGCSLGCHYCYAAAMARRFKRSFAPTCHPERLDQPLKLKKPARIFVDSAGDLFDPAIPTGFIREVFDVMARAKQHTSIVLTKQAKRMHHLLTYGEPLACDSADHHRLLCTMPLPNAHLGITVTNQRDADERIPLLLQTPAAVRFVSCEPLLKPITFPQGWLDGTCDHPCGDYLYNGECQCTTGRGPNSRLDWIIVGAQTGPDAKPPEPKWVQSLIDQCRAADVPLFLKNNLQWTEEIKEYPR